MPMKEILTRNASALREISSAVDAVGQETEQLISDLLDTLKSTNELGVGLSANQIGVTQRVFVAKIAENEAALAQMEPTVFINPEITWQSEETTLSTDPERNFLEGCLSLPNIYAFVERPLHIEITYHTLDTMKEGQPAVTEHLSDYNAVVVQHEIDHLNGILFTDHAIQQDQKIYEIIDGKDPRVITL